ncbi:hypothetical protein ALTER154_10057 [Alteromonas sp. 154]|nr:hypothetical protein ALTER154_10057 [Alteromonas sp. 154]
MNVSTIETNPHDKGTSTTAIIVFSLSLFVHRSLWARPNFDGLLSLVQLLFSL